MLLDQWTSPLATRAAAASHAQSGPWVRIPSGGPSPLPLAELWENSSNEEVSKKGGCSASLSWFHSPLKERKQGLATLHQKQKRIPLLYCPQREGRSSCPASSSLFYRYSSHSQYCLENEGKDHKSCSNYFLWTTGRSQFPLWIRVAEMCNF